MRMRSKFVTGAVALAAVTSLAGVPAEAASGRERGNDRTALQRDTDAIAALGVAGVQARTTGSAGRSVVASSGVSDIGTGRPVPPTAYFRIGSINKTFVATVVLHLVGEGRLGLDDTVERRLPGVLRGNGNRGDRITIRQLLQHTSGISDESYPGFDSAEEYYAHRYDIHTPEEIVALAMRHRPVFEPGRGWSYSNTGYAVLGLVIEKVTGRPWYEEVSTRIIRPLRLHHTVWPGTSATLPRPHLRGYQRFESGGPLVDVTELIDADASGGLISTTADLDRFVRALLGGRLLRPELLRQMQRTVPVDEETNQIMPGARYGLGLSSRPLSCGGTYWTHGGDQLGYRTRNGVADDGRRSVVVAMSTQFNQMDSALGQEKLAHTLVDNALCHERTAPLAD
ncbi:serine hydrolase domain-containing protein [Streptomyces lincolnensis]|uniref:serine hydrolase domain-containing protein n=1 Tax=Streptomyces lincolnensis TaxID=1915 RepID=UPI000AC55CD2|nr:serine hydrolase domain-containing protein [Streptomyces lincolnensis]